MAAPDERNPRWEKTLESRGVESVRNLLARSPGPGAGAIVPGLGDATADMPTRIYAETWLARKVAEHEARQDKRARTAMIWTVIGALAAAAAAVMSFIDWWFPAK